MTQSLTCSAVLLLLLCSIVSAAEPKLKLVEGPVVRVTATDFVVKAPAGEEIAYPMPEISNHVRYSTDILKAVAADQTPGASKFKYTQRLEPKEVKPGTVVKVNWGFASLKERDKVQEGNFYQIEIQKEVDAATK